MRLLPRGLRARTILAFALLALVLSTALGLSTYQITRQYLLEQRETLATRQAMTNALVARGLVAAANDRTEPTDIAESLRAASNARSVLRVGDRWFAAVVEVNQDAIPPAFVAALSPGTAQRQRVEVNDAPYLLVGVALPGLDVDYFEFASLRELQRNLEIIGAVLLIAGSTTTVIGAGVGWLVARRLLRPLTAVAEVAAAMSDGDLSRRLEVRGDPDLRPMAESFNEMASSLEARIARELRFTADVSHELRTPLTAMASAVGLARRGDLSGRARFAVDVLDQQVHHLQRLTLELLEISRIDAGVAEMRLEETDVVALTRRIARSHRLGDDVVTARLGDGGIWAVDPVRFERIVENLVENAERYGGGPTRIELHRSGGDLVLMVDDAGPGVPVEERIAIFGRFHRGAAEQPLDRPKGTGLGLALVDEHVRLHSGSVWVTDSPEGGARFVVRLPRLPSGDPR